MTNEQLRRPNILVVLTDDHAAHSIGAYATHPSPNGVEDVEVAPQPDIPISTGFTCPARPSMFRTGDSVGDGNLIDGEKPVHTVRVRPISMDATAVTNADFAPFTEDTAYVTEAEQYESSAVFHLALTAPEEDVEGHRQRVGVVRRLVRRQPVPAFRNG